MPVDSHHLGHGFRVDVDKGERYRAALDRLERADAWGQVERCLGEATALQRQSTPDIRMVDELHVVLLLGDPTDMFFVNVTGGYFGIGGFPGYLTVTVWPTDANEHKVGFYAVHELHHNLRFSTVDWDVAAVTVGSEGLAKALTAGLSGGRRRGDP